MEDYSKFRLLKGFMTDKKSVNSLGYAVCVQVVGRSIVVSQPDLELHKTLLIDDLKSPIQVGNMVIDMMTLARVHSNQMRNPPAPSTPKGALKIPKLAWVSVKEASEYLEVSQNTIRRLCNAGILRCEKTHGGHRKIPLKDLQEYKTKGQMLFDCSTETKQEEPLLSLFDLFLDQPAS